jgi:hypothetical protein
MTLTAPAHAPVLVREAANAAGGGADLHAPSRTLWLDGAVWVLDSGNNRLVRFDSTLSGATVHAREGEGPGEIRFAIDMTVDRGRLVVGEAGNGRVSVFDAAGRFERTVRVPGVPKLVTASGGSIFTAPGASGDYTDHVDGRPHASVPEAVRRIVRDNPRDHPPADAYPAAGPDGPVHVVDASVLAVASFDGRGRLLDLRLLPDPFRARLLERRRVELEAWGARAGSFLSVPATKRASIDDRGRLLVPFSLPGHWGLLIDPRSWTARPLSLPDGEPARGILWSASDAHLVDGRLYVLSQDRLYQFDVSEWG